MKRLLELVSDEQTGRLSHTKLWPNIANAVATILFIRLGWKDQLTVEVWWAYLACVGGYTCVMRLAQAVRRRKVDDAA
ncbi:hypothetical protein [Cupriavidus gilardii]|uniref:hypothetical protein n=1 Tax=Cupriavidus gilardii TaxID=82541 RepID=UPI001573DFA7|nr:hypothetical protein [Cupriavidus gilardii]NSX04821.1 hypothetical protein [Cupriavidus gilardii]UXC35143.1 hypothetical protein N4G38_12080 [Cupriavidus gilardii]